MLINLFEIPEWLKESGLTKQLMENLTDLEVGSSKWIEEMSKTLIIEEMPPKTDKINNINDFLSVINASNYWLYNYLELQYPLSVYIYSYINRKEVLKVLMEKQKIVMGDILKVEQKLKNPSNGYTTDEAKDLDFIVYIFKKENILKIFTENKDMVLNILERDYPSQKEIIDMLKYNVSLDISPVSVHQPGDDIPEDYIPEYFLTFNCFLSEKLTFKANIPYIEKLKNLLSEKRGAIKNRYYSLPETKKILNKLTFTFIHEENDITYEIKLDNDNRLKLISDLENFLNAKNIT